MTNTERANHNVASSMKGAVGSDRTSQVRSRKLQVRGSLATHAVWAALAVTGCGFRSGLDGFESESDDEGEWRGNVTGGNPSLPATTSGSSSGYGGASPNMGGVSGHAPYGGTWGSIGSSNSRTRPSSTTRGGQSGYGGARTRPGSTPIGGFGPSSSRTNRGGQSSWGGKSGWGGSKSLGGNSNNDPLCPASQYVKLGCLEDVMEGTAALCNDLDDDCDGTVDEGCPCTPGSVKPCFAGPPLRRNVGVCRDGLQTCEGRAGAGRWGVCVGGMVPQLEVCDTIDNDCDGCRDEVASCVPVGSCPSSGDPRIPVLRPFDRHYLNVSDFYQGDARSYSWSIEGGPCDQVAPTGIKSYDLRGENDENAEFVPRLSGDYTVYLTVEALSGELFQCNWVVPVRGPGLRIEMCYPESDTQDLDLYLKRLSTQTAWFDSFDVQYPNVDTCSWYNCEAVLRNNQKQRANWGYANSDLAECIGGPQGDSWKALGYCANPRLDIDNNLSQGTGMPENINIDLPRDGDGFRIMVQNFTGDIAHPIVNVYCGGVRTATFGAPPDPVTTFFTPRTSTTTIGAMWRVADVQVRVSEDGAVSCDVEGLHPDGSDSEYFITLDDISF